MTKALIVDDDELALTTLEKLLTVKGYEATTVNDSSKAHEMALLVKPDVFLLDLMMPDPDGFKLCRILRADPIFLFTPILVVTALDDNSSRVVAFGAGANDYITKPVLPKELVERIENVVRGKRLGLYEE